MDTAQRHALAEFVVESANGIKASDWNGVNVLWQEMATEAGKAGVILPLTSTIAKITASNGETGEMSSAEIEAFLKGWAFCFDDGQ